MATAAVEQSRYQMRFVADGSIEHRLHDIHAFAADDTEASYADEQSQYHTHFV